MALNIMDVENDDGMGNEETKSKKMATEVCRALDGFQSRVPVVVMDNLRLHQTSKYINSNRPSNFRTLESVTRVFVRWTIDKLHECTIMP